MVMAECLTVLISSSGDTKAGSLSPSSSPQPLLSVRHMGGGVYRTSESSSEPSSSSCDTFKTNIQNLTLTCSFKIKLELVFCFLPLYQSPCHSNLLIWSLIIIGSQLLIKVCIIINVAA